MTTKLCKDCKWCDFDEHTPSMSDCTNPKCDLILPDFVTGENKRTHRGCNYARIEPCENAKYWDASQP